MIISIHQPHYLPAYQYFDKIKRSDIFVFLDDVQFEKNGWQNRNRIKTKQGIQWLTVPVLHNFGQKISEVKIDGIKWIKKHIATIEQNFKCKKICNWRIIKDVLEMNYTSLSDLNCKLISTISYEIFKTKNLFFRSSDLKIDTDDPDERLIEIIKKLKGSEYLAGIGGKNYMNLKKYPFKVIFQDYKEDEPLSVLHRILQK